MSLSFGNIMTFIFKWEGDYVNDKDDPGGETKFGISKRSYSDLDIKNLTKQKAQEIYKRDYWDAIRGDTLDPALAAVALDTAINMGVSRANKFLLSTKDWKSYLQLRRSFYLQILDRNPKMGKYYTGWMNRLMDLSKFVEANQNS